MAINQIHFFRPNNQSDRIVGELEEYVLDDVSATVAEFDVDTDFRTAQGDIVHRVRIHYVSAHEPDVVAMMHLLLNCVTLLTEVEIAFLRGSIGPPTPRPQYNQVGEPLSRRQLKRKKQISFERDREPDDWDETETYTVEKRMRRICDMEDDTLYLAIIWMARNRAEFFRNARHRGDVTMPPSSNEALGACCWLRDRPLFRALVKESIRRMLTYPPDVFHYLKDYVLDKKNTLDGYKPWRDPGQADQGRALQPFLDQPTTPFTQQFGKEGRAIDFGNNS